MPICCTTRGVPVERWSPLIRRSVLRRTSLRASAELVEPPEVGSGSRLRGSKHLAVHSDPAAPGLPRNPGDGLQSVKTYRHTTLGPDRRPSPGLRGRPGAAG